MNVNKGEFVYRLRIRNETASDLAVLARELRQGVWCRDGEGGEDPASVPAGAEIEALAIRARSTGKPAGYEFRCVWGAPPDGDGRGSIAVTVSVPFSPGKNRAGLDVSGMYAVEGWTGVSILGRAFAHTLVVKKIAGM